MIRAAIAGASGYTGGELIRLLHFHPEVEVTQVTSERLAGKLVHNAPQSRKVSKLKFKALDELEFCDRYSCVPHDGPWKASTRSERWRRRSSTSPGISDFDPSDYDIWYGKTHPRPELLSESFTVSPRFTVTRSRAPIT